MSVENHPLLRDNPELAEKLLDKYMADAGFARAAQQYATLDEQLQKEPSDTLQQEHAALKQQLLADLNKPKAGGSCCGGCGGGH